MNILICKLWEALDAFIPHLACKAHANKLIMRFRTNVIGERCWSCLKPHKGIHWAYELNCANILHKPNLTEGRFHRHYSPMFVTDGFSVLISGKYCTHCMRQVPDVINHTTFWRRMNSVHGQLQSFLTCDLAFMCLDYLNAWRTHATCHFCNDIEATWIV